jgi:hypothetical protein
VATKHPTPSFTLSDPASTDMRMRLRLIVDECKDIQKRMGSNERVPGKRAPASARLAYQVGYLAMIVQKHLETGET